MSKNKNQLVLTILLVLSVALGCGYLINPIPAKDAAEQFLTALRDGDYARALELMNNDDSKPDAKKVEEFKKEIESGRLQPQSWSLQSKYVSKTSGKTNNSYEIITGTVTFKDGGTGTFHMEARALGLKKNPWRLSDFELKR